MSPRDPGLQPERTALAWNRTALSLAGNAFLVTRAGIQSGGRAMLVAGVALGVFAIGLMALAQVRRRQLARSGPGAPASAVVAMTTGAVVLAAACGFWSIVG